MASNTSGAREQRNVESEPKVVTETEATDRPRLTKAQIEELTRPPKWLRQYGKGF